MNAVRYNTEDQIFVVSSEEFDRQLEISTQLRFNAAVDPNLYTIHLFVNHAAAENSIFEVHDALRRKRIGWMIPLTALDSQEHTFAENIHFLRYAQVGIHLYLLKKWTFNPEIFSSRLNFGSVISDDTLSIFICNDATLSISRFLPDLGKVGYFPTDLPRQTGTSNQNQINQKFSNLSKRLNIRSAAKIYPSNYIDYLCSTIISGNIDPLLQFLFLYQACEIGIQEEFNTRVEEFITYYHQNTARDTIFFYQQRTKLMALTQELTRLRSLVDRIDIAICNDLKEVCNDFLISNGHRGENDAAKALYKVRNLVVHNLAAVAFRADFSRVIKAFIPLALEMLTLQHLPPAILPSIPQDHTFTI